MNPRAATDRPRLTIPRAAAIAGIQFSVLLIVSVHILVENYRRKAEPAPVSGAHFS
jgi:hypothetical protein